MNELTRTLESVAERGHPRGADVVVDAAIDLAHDHRLDESVVPGRPNRRRHLGRAVLRAAVSLAAAVALVTAGTYIYVREKLDDIDRVDLRAELTDAGATTPSEPMTMLVVGSDTRQFVDDTDADADRFGSSDDVGGERADALMLLRFDPVAGRAAVLSVPRDLWVQISGTSARQRVNAALGDGAGTLVATVQDVLGIAIDHYVQLDFVGFRRVVDALGGVDVAFDAAARDQVTGLDVPAAGCVHLDGEQALALVRSRHYQISQDGRWRSDPTGDLGRIRRQQDFVLSVLADMGSTSNPLTVNRLLDVLADHLTLDSTFSTDELLAVGRRLRSFDPSDVRLLTVPAVPIEVNGAAVLQLVASDLAAVVDEFVHGQPVDAHPVDPGAGDAPTPEDPGAEGIAHLTCP